MITCQLLLVVQWYLFIADHETIRSLNPNIQMRLSGVVVTTLAFGAQRS